MNENNNPLLDKLMLPGETIPLPSLGMFYLNDELDSSVKNGEIHIHPMTTIDEITIKSPDLLYSGEAINKIFSRCIPQVNKPLELLSIDVDFILLCLRKLSYGSEMEIMYTHTCENATEHSYVLNIEDHIKASKRLDPTLKPELILPNNQKVVLHPVRYKNSIATMQAMSNLTIEYADKEIEPEKERDLIIQSIYGVISSVDGITDEQFIIDWLKQVPPVYIKKINKKIDEFFTFGATYSSNVKCLDCGELITLNTPTNPITFFT